MTPARPDSAVSATAPTHVSTATASRLPRRRFLARTAAASGVLLLPSIIPAAVRGAAGAVAPSERVTVGVIGRGAMGAGHQRRLTGDPGFQVLAVCDVDDERCATGRDAVNDHYASARASGTYRGCDAYRDYRELLARTDIDAVVIVTPDHWHALQAIDAARAGKDIYLEKPISMTIEEGRRVVEAVRCYGRVFQTGTQYRSISTIRQICQFVRDGGLGRVKSVFTVLSPLAGFFGAERFRPYDHVLDVGICGKAYVPMDFALPPEPVPAGLDWDLWVGPAPWRPYNQLYHVNPSPGVVPWSFSDAFGVTASTWYLSHAADVIHYAIGMERSGPVEILHPADGAFPTLTFRFANGVLLHFVDHWGLVKTLYGAVPADAKLAGNFGGVFVGERGWLTSMTTGGPIDGGPDEVFEAMGMRSREVNVGSNNHHANWLECIRTRQSPSSDEELGHRSASVGHLANIAFWTGQSLRWDPEGERFVGNDAANRLLTRSTRAPWRL
jgi:hypothetical protein